MNTHRLTVLAKQYRQHAADAHAKAAATKSPMFLTLHTAEERAWTVAADELRELIDSETLPHPENRR